MPRYSIDYSKTIMYKLCCKDINIIDCYVGHTTDFKARSYCHKSRCSNFNSKFYNLNVYQFIRDNGNWDNWVIIMIEKYPCSNLLEATKRERELMEELKATLNSQNPSQTRKEYNYNYRNKNKEDINARQKEFYENNKEKYKMYYENNKEYNDRKNRIYYENNKEKVKCECGCEITKHNLKKHQQTKRHQENILN